MKNNNGFMLDGDVFLVGGAKRGAIYDLRSGEVYSISEVSLKVLALLESGLSVSKILEAVPKLEPDQLINFLFQLEKINLGKFLENAEIAKKMSLDVPDFNLNFMWLELTERCNLNCVHCYNKSSGRRSAKKELKLRDWERVIREASILGCKKIQLIGGEPLIFGKNIWFIIDLARRLGYEMIEIFSNATLFTDEFIELMSCYNICAAVSVYSKRAEIHDAVTRTLGSFERTMESIRKLKAKGVSVRLATVVVKQNEDFLTETLNFFEEMGETQVSRCFDIVRPVGRGENICLTPSNLNSWRYRKNPVFPKISRNIFVQRKYGHSCWKGSIAITSGGDVLPCIMARKMKCGNVTQQSLHEILKGKNLRRLWGLSKDKIKKCKDCEYRYLCIDCRPSIRGNITGSDPFCTYNPYEGKWQTITPLLQLS